MNSNFRTTAFQFLTTLPESLKRAFDATATWVTQLSWWKFFLFAILMLAAGGITQSMLFSSSHTRVASDDSGSRHARNKSRTLGDNDTEVQIDQSGIHIRKNKSASVPAADEVDPATPPPPPPPPSPPQTVTQGPTATLKNDEVHITLPPGVGKEVQDAISEAVDDAAAQKVETYREKSSEWFMNFVLLLVLGLFGTKALVGGKKRAEAEAAAANTIAEREAMQRQVTEAKMQMMQAQVEPHFLFNTLASVEYLIETDPPRASRMQRSLIQYLRAVLPQMRENAPITNLGREVDMVRAYLDLLKMRMEERLIVECHIPDGLRSAAFPPMMLQSMVENAIKHGLECKPEGGNLTLSAEIADNKLRVTVADTGMGFGTVPSDGTGLGLQNIRERLKLLHGGAGQLIIAPNKPSGVLATIEVPYQLAR
jgi:hypothetical protein